MIYDEFYPEGDYQPSEVDEILAEAKGKIEAVVKDATGRSIKDIIAENKLLKSSVEACNKDKRDYEFMKRKLQNEHDNRISELEREFNRSKIWEIFKKCNPVAVGYTLKGSYVKGIKCSYCNDDSKVVAIDTFGREHLVKCSCKKSIYFYSVKETHIAQIQFWRTHGLLGGNVNANAYYPAEDVSSSDLIIIDLNTPAKEVFDPVEAEDTYRVVYTTLEEAQKHCDYLNEKAGYTADKYPVDKGNIKSNIKP